jgi:hypothetical protein
MLAFSGEGGSSRPCVAILQNWALGSRDRGCSRTGVDTEIPRRHSRTCSACRSFGRSVGLAFPLGAWVRVREVAPQITNPYTDAAFPLDRQFMRGMARCSLPLDRHAAPVRPRFEPQGGADRVYLQIYFRPCRNRPTPRVIIARAHYSSSRSPLNEAWRSSPAVVKPR